MDEVIEEKKDHTLTIIQALLVVGFIVFVAVQPMLSQTTKESTITAQAAAPSIRLDGGKQIVKVSFDGSYYPNPIKLKKGVPAILDVDLNSVRGCLRNIIIPAFGIRKTVSTGDNKIEFTPDKAGTFGMSCSMGMGRGQIVVEDENGVVPNTNTVAQDTAKAGSCGSGGGCGCGS